MINVVFEGSTGAGKTTIIKNVKEIYEKNYKVGVTNDIDKSTPLYNVIRKMYNDNVLVTLNENFNTLRYETLLQAADYLFLREKIYSENNDINLFDRSYFSVYSYQSVLLENNIDNSQDFMNSVLSCMKSGDKKIDLLVFFDINIETSLERSQNRDNRKFTDYEKDIFKKFNNKMKDFIKHNESELNLLIIDDNDTMQEIINKTTNKLNEIIELKNK